MSRVLLNESQQKAIEHGKGPLLIIAGAGTGKTTVVTERIKYLIQKKKISPEHILALTFTEKAAAEMEDRIDKIMPYGYTQMWISTFHSFCDQILKTEGIQIGLVPNYKLISEAESVQLFKKNLFKLKLDYYRPLGNPTKFIEALLTHFARLKDEDITPQQYTKFAARKLKTAKNPEDIEDATRINELAAAFSLYEEIKTKEGLMDFSDLISNTLLLLRTRKKVLQSFQKQFEFILVDEFQDTNFAQNELAIMLAGNNKNITVVADDDQAIYRWRGAAISNVMQFKKNFPTAKLVTLTQNYRSTQEILDSAYQMIQHNNPNRLEAIENISKKLKSSKKGRGDKIELVVADRVDEEAEEIAKKITSLVNREKYKYEDIAILVRANNHAHPITTILARHKIPYQFLGPGQLFQQEEIKDLIAYLRVLYNLHDSISLFRVLQMDLFQIPMIDLNYLLNYAKRKNQSIFESLSHLNETYIQEKTQEKLLTIKSMIERHLERTKKDSAGQILFYFLSDAGLYEKYMAVASAKEEKEAQNIAKFFDRIKTYETSNEDSSVYAVVDWIDLMTQLGDSPLASVEDWKNSNAVSILTVHSSKGLEFPVVFLVNLVNDRFPSRERQEKIPVPSDLVKEHLMDEGNYHEQEERRLFYVGMTRAKDKLFFTASKFYGEGKREKKLSPFIAEAAPDLVKQKTEQEKIKQLSFANLMNEYQEIKQAKQLDAARKITYISYSQLQTFDICPLHYKARYLLGLPTPPTAALSFGISMHEVLQEFYTLLKNKNSADEDTFVKLLSDVWKNEGYIDRDHEKAMKKNGEKLLRDYFNNIHNPQNIPVAMEMPFSFRLNKELKVGGKIDRIDKSINGAIEIIDYKTGKPSTNKKSYMFQLGLYALAAQKVEHPLLKQKPEDITVSLLYLETGEKVSAQISQDKLEKVEEEIITKVKAIETSDFKCSKSILCGNCEYKMLCNVN